MGIVDLLVMFLTYFSRYSIEYIMHKVSVPLLPASKLPRGVLYEAVMEVHAGHDQGQVNKKPFTRMLSTTTFSAASMKRKHAPR